MNTYLKHVLACALLAAFAAGCGGGSGGGGQPASGPSSGAIQVLNNSGMDLADVEIHVVGGAKVDEIGGGLAQGATFLFGNLPAGTYDVLAFPPGSGIQKILRYDNNVVAAGQMTDLTLTP